MIYRTQRCGRIYEKGADGVSDIHSHGERETEPLRSRVFADFKASRPKCLLLTTSRFHAKTDCEGTSPTRSHVRERSANKSPFLIYFCLRAWQSLKGKLIKGLWTDLIGHECLLTVSSLPLLAMCQIIGCFWDTVTNIFFSFDKKSGFECTSCLLTSFIGSELFNKLKTNWDAVERKFKTVL